MPKNKLMYVGVLVVAATALLWAGAEILSRITYVFGYSLAAGVLLIIAGLFMEARKPKVNDGEHTKQGE